ncbi:tripartite tricarboxylate transporter substrate binding protein [Pelagibacterium luteolum]|nr:tripartite tricarboxylate transporter substrate binding protein [Pelagibacterium luteolum]
MIVAAQSASAQSFPEHEITMIIPFAAGGGTDQAARRASMAAEDGLGVSIVPENRPGGGSIPGMMEAMRSAPDGYTLVTAATPIATAQHLGIADLSHEDFDVVGLINFDPPVITVAADSELQTIEDYVERAKNNPGQLTIGTTPPQGAWHVAARVFEEQSGLDLNIVPFPGGAAEAVTSLLGDHVESVGVSLGEVYSHLNAGTVRVLAVGSSERMAQIPDVPTYDEAGITTDFPPVGAFRVVLAPKGLPSEELEILRDAFFAAAQDEEYMDFLDEFAFGHMALAGDDAIAFLDEQFELFGEILASNE